VCEERVVARAIWSGSISFGLINIPVKLYSAITEKQVRFNQIDTRNNARVRMQKVNAEDGSEVPADVIAKGYEITKGNYVLVTEDELASLQPRATHTIDLDEFVDLADVDPIYFSGAYHVAPDERAAKPYALLTAAMEQAGKVAIARFVMRSKQYVAVLRPRDGKLLLSMLVYADEINPAIQIPEFEDLESVELTERELAMAEQLVASLSADFEPERFSDTYREELLDLIHAKADGAEPVLASVEAPAEDKVVDLMAALEASVAAARSARGRHPSAGAVAAAESDGTAEVDEADGTEVPDQEVQAGEASNGSRTRRASGASKRRGAAKTPAKASTKASTKVSTKVSPKPATKPRSKAPAKKPAAARKSA
jgi:DNA end-binding protein Ku